MTSLIDIGKEKQLFLDENLVERITGARQELHLPRKAGSEPIIPADRPWEGNALVMRTVLHDPQDGLYKMWYRTSNVISRRNPGTGALTVEYNGDSRSCLAVSTDGWNWEKPDLGRVEFDGSRHNNILPAESDIADRKNIFLDTQEPEPSRRFKAMGRFSDGDPELVARLEKDPSVYYEMDAEHAEALKRKGNWTSLGWNLYHSADGLAWEPYEGNPVFRDPPQARTWAGPARFMGWDPIRQVYAVHMEACQHARSPLMKRLIGRAESPDLVHWSRPETILVPDEQDPLDTQFYFAAIAAYHGVYVGLLTYYFTEQGIIVPHLVFSRDGIHYDRRFREPFIPVGEADSYEGREIYAEVPLVSGDDLLIFYTGRIAGHGTGPFYERATEADSIYAGIGMASLPLDGFCSIDAGDGEAEVVTRAFSFSGDRLQLNLGAADTARPLEVKVELLGPAHHHIPGFTVQDADPIHTPGVRQTVSWNGASDLSRFRGEPVKLHIRLRNAQLRALQFV